MSGTGQTGLTNHISRLQQNHSATSVESGSLQPGGTTTRARPQSMSEPHLRSATSLSTLMRPAPGVIPKRVTLVQGEFASLEPSAFGGSTQAMLEHKVQTVFDQFHMVMDQRLADDRKGTTPVFTLPEFFWNDFGSNVSPEDRQHVLQMIADKAGHDKFSQAVFVLGTIMTSTPPAMLAGLTGGNLDAIANGLGQDPQGIATAYQEAHNTDYERFGSRTSHDRINLAASVSIAQELGNGSPTDEHFTRAGDAVRTMREHETPYMLLAGFATPETLTNTKLNAFRAAKTPEDKLARFQQLCPGAPDSAAEFVEEMHAMVTETKSNRQFNRRLDLFTNHFLPFNLTRLKLINDRAEPTAMAKHPGLKFLDESPNYNMEHAITTGSAMYKQLTNEAIVMQGGSKTNGLHTIRKFAPSDIDVPSYNQERRGQPAPPFPHKFQQQPGGLNPSVSERDIQQRLANSGYQPQHQVTFSGERDLSMTTVVCRDIDTAMFKEAISSEVNQTDLFVLISAGITTGVFDKNAPSNGIVAQNDGHFKQADIRHGHMQRRVPTQVFLQETHGGQFQKVESTEKTRFVPGGPGRVRISSPVHLKGAPPSSVGSWQQEAPFERARLVSELDDYGRELEFLDGLENAFNSAVDDIGSKSNHAIMRDLEARGVKFNPDQAQRIEENPRQVIQELREIVAGDMNATLQLRQSAENRLAQLEQPSS